MMIDTFSTSASSEDDDLINYPSVSDVRLNTLKVGSTYCQLDSIDGSLEAYRGSRYNVIHLNIHSLPRKYTQLCNILAKLKENRIQIHLVLLCETFLTSANAGMYQIPGYSFISANRTTLTRGGVGIYILHGITYNERTDLCINVEGEYESIALEIIDRFYKQKIIVAEIYRVPNTNEILSIQRYEQMLENICDYSKCIVIGTDQNFDYKKVDEEQNTSDLLDVFFTRGVLPTVYRPTRVTHTSCTIIDNVYIKCPGYRNIDS